MAAMTKKMNLPSTSPIQPVNPEILLSPLTTNEAVLSSKIEGTQATLDEVLKFEAGMDLLEERKKQDVQEIINYRSTLILAEQELKNRP